MTDAETKALQAKTQKHLVIVLALFFLGFITMFGLSAWMPHYYFQALPDSKGIWKLESNSGDAEYCQVKTDAFGKVIAGECKPVPRKK